MPGGLAIEGGAPVRKTLLPYGRHAIIEEDVQAVAAALRSDWITSGPRVADFEKAVASRVGARHAVAFSSGTAALHGAAFAAGLEAGDEAVTTPLTFCATANAALYQGAVPVFADVSADTLNLDPARAEEKISPRTKALIPVDYAGHPADMDAFMALAKAKGLVVIEDACHSLGARLAGRSVGSLAHMTVFSFHPVKHVATGEGGMVATDDDAFARRLRMFRSHGIDSEARARQEKGEWRYDMEALGWNYRLTDVASALGLSQLGRLDENLRRRCAVAARYAEAFRGSGVFELPPTRAGAEPAWHLYPVRLAPGRWRVGRDQVFRALRAEGIGVNVHYIPVHFHSYYKGRFGDRRGLCPAAEGAYENLISLPMFHGLQDGDVADVIAAVQKVVAAYAR